MNLADYVSELLAQHDEVSMPGLGYFAWSRINGYYNDEEAKFCPPRHEVAYVPELKDDDLLAQYVADKKKISLATSKYFAEKFVSDLREKAESGDFIFSNLGLFHTEQGQLIFYPNKSLPDNSFYGYTSVTLNKLKIKEPEYKEPTPVEPVISDVIIPEPVAAESVYADTSMQAALATPIAEATTEPEIINEEEEVTEKRRTPVWLVLLIIVGIIALSILGAYLINPSIFNKLTETNNTKQASKVQPVVPVTKPDTDSVKTDTAKVKNVVKDSTAKTAVVATIDTLKQYRFQIIIDAEKKLEIANSEIARYKKIGLDVKISTDLPGRRLKLTAGTYFTKKEADSALTSLKKLHKVSNQSYIIPIIPKK
jgi:nucleoid DNA-binding protein